MRFLRIAILSALFVLPASFAKAGVVGSAFVELTGLQLTIDGEVATGNFNAPSGSAQVSVTSFLTEFENSSSLTGQANGFEFGTVSIKRSADGGEFTSLETPSASGVVSGGFPSDYTRSGSGFGNSFADLSSDSNATLAAATVGGFATTGADFSVVTPGLTGAANSKVRNTTSFDFISNVDGTGSIDFTAFSNLFLENTTGDYTTRAASSFVVQLQRNRSGSAEQFSLTVAERDLLNKTISLGGVGSTSYSGGGDFSIEFDMKTNDTFSFTITQTADISLRPVPEPATVLSFVGLGLVGIGAARRRRSPVAM